MSINPCYNYPNETHPLLLGILILSVLVLVTITAYPSLFSSQQAAIASAQTPTAFSFKQSSYTVQEGNVVRITIVAPQNLTQTTRLPIRIQSGTAKSGSDFRTPSASTVTFYKGGLKEKTISITTIRDSRAEQAETFTVRLGTSGPQVTVTINDKSTTTSSTSQNPPVNCPSPYVSYGRTGALKIPVTVVARPVTFLWALQYGPTAGQGRPFPGIFGALYGRAQTYPAGESGFGPPSPVITPGGGRNELVQVNTVQAYEFTLPSKTWDGTELTKDFYTSYYSPDGTQVAPYEVPVIDRGFFQVAHSPEISTSNPAVLSCRQAPLIVSIDECPGIIDPGRDVKLNPTIIGGVPYDTYRECTMGSEGRIEWSAVGSNAPTANYACQLAYGKKYYLNISRAYDYNVVPEQDGFTGGIIQRGDVVQCAIRLESRRYIQ